MEVRAQQRRAVWKDRVEIQEYIYILLFYCFRCTISLFSDFFKYVPVVRFKSERFCPHRDPCRPPFTAPPSPQTCNLPPSQSPCMRRARLQKHVAENITFESAFAASKCATTATNGFRLSVLKGARPQSLPQRSPSQRRSHACCSRSQQLNCRDATCLFIRFCIESDFFQAILLTSPLSAPSRL
jgi:hypothetical protein